MTYFHDDDVKRAFCRAVIGFLINLKYGPPCVRLEFRFYRIIGNPPIFTLLRAQKKAKRKSPNYFRKHNFIKNIFLYFENANGKLPERGRPGQIQLCN